MVDNAFTNNVTIPENVGPTVLAGRYRVVRQLGQGGMGSVWLAEDTKLDGRKVAVKMLPSILVSNKRAYRQVKDEALVSLKLSHPNIVPVRSFEEDNGNPFLVMDYIDGQTLDDHLADKGKLSEEETVKLLKPIAAALDYAHTQGVVHRDVKPGNVMIAADGHPYILDFGIAREVQETMTRVTGKLSSGTLMYMSPEQLNGAAPKPAQDIYSFAAMAYECLKGEPPFTRGQIEFQIVNSNPEPLDPQFANCGPGVMAGLAKTPEARPTTCTAVLTVRAKHTKSMCDGISARKARLPSALLGVLAVAVFVVGGWWWGRGTEKNRVSARTDDRTVGSEQVSAETRSVRQKEMTLESAVIRRPPSDKDPKAGVDQSNATMSKQDCGVLLERETVSLNGVQLWKNGPYWAECNVGASKPEECGYYFWWGDTVGYKRVGTDWNAVNGSRTGFMFDSNCPTHWKDASELKSLGYIDSADNLIPSYDAATAHLGAPWRMPTIQELDELWRNCTTSWEIRNGVSGRLVTGKGQFSSKSIFLPAAGGGYDSYFYSLGTNGYYWSSTSASRYSGGSYGLGFDSRKFDLDRRDRYAARAVRPVRESANYRTK